VPGRLYQFGLPYSRVGAGAASKLYPEPNPRINDADLVFFNGRIRPYLVTIEMNRICHICGTATLKNVFYSFTFLYFLLDF
jgi:hypothetical protein